LGSRWLLEHDVDRLEIELLGQVQNRQIFVVEFQVLVGAVAVAVHKSGQVAPVGFLVAFQVHAT
jgi:hypothetical protein